MQQKILNYHMNQIIVKMNRYTPSSLGLSIALSVFRFPKEALCKASWALVATALTGEYGQKRGKPGCKWRARNIKNCIPPGEPIE